MRQPPRCRRESYVGSLIFVSDGRESSLASVVYARWMIDRHGLTATALGVDSAWNTPPHLLGCCICASGAITPQWSHQNEIHSEDLRHCGILSERPGGHGFG